MKKINPETQPGLAALKKESPETVKKMGKSPDKITKKDGGMIKGYKNGGCVMVKTNQKPHMS